MQDFNSSNSVQPYTNDSLEKKRLSKTYNVGQVECTHP